LGGGRPGGEQADDGGQRNACQAGGTVAATGCRGEYSAALEAAPGDGRALRDGPAGLLSVRPLF
ncbi:MAG TPA: hypothetical protein VGB88_05165, partial [Alphaproteobacteria bacterium]